jgi:hypothetical protein
MAIRWVLHRVQLFVLELLDLHLELKEPPSQWTVRE